MVGDPEDIRALAARVRGEADRARQLAVRVGRTRDVPWRSAAASAFRDRATDRAHSLRRTAEEMDEAAGWLDRHATAVAATIDELTRVARLGEQLAREAARQVARRVGQE